MAYILNGRRFSYDYTEILSDLREDVEDGIITLNESINIVRGEAIRLTDEKTYRPIIDYYRQGILELLQEPLEWTEFREDYTDEEWNHLLKEREAVIKEYWKDEPNFEKATVLAVIAEMEQWDSIF